MSSLPSNSAQVAAIEDDYNSQLLGILLMGVYTVIFFGTLYVYAKKSWSKNRIVMASISLSYLAYVVVSGLQWYLGKVAFVINGTSREAIYLATYASPEWVVFINDVCSFLISGLADGLLIWRCFHVWGRSFRAILIPCLLLFCEIVSDLSTIIIIIAARFEISAHQIYVVDILIAISLFITSTTTMLTTVLIAYKIYSVSRDGILKRSRIRFNHIAEILVQSAAVYSVASLAWAILSVVPVTENDLGGIIAALNYSGPLYFFIAGVAPTVMVARVALAPDTSSNISALTPISGLNFRTTVPNMTHSARRSFLVANVTSTSVTVE